MLSTHARAASSRAVTPLARLLLRSGVSPDAVTIAGAAGTVGAALWLLPRGHLAPGALVIAVFVCTDMLDGVMARLQGPTGAWGAFLDSTLDRVGDAAIFTGLLVYFAVTAPPEDRSLPLAGVLLACLVLAMLVSYARARAEGLGIRCDVGIAERADRLVVVLVAVLATGLGAPTALLTAAMTLLALASLVTVGQRVALVRRQTRDPRE